MKSDNQPTKSKNHSTIATKKTADAKKSADSQKNKGVVPTETPVAATTNAKAKAGSGLANEGTIVSYDQER